MPVIVDIVLPIAMLMATLFSVGQMARYLELTALFAAGCHGRAGPSWKMGPDGGGAAPWAAVAGRATGQVLEKVDAILEEYTTICLSRSMSSM